MKFSKLAQKTLIALTFSGLISTGLVAKTIDVSKSKKDIRVMTRIIEASLESSAKNFPGNPRIEGTYLAEQGYLFSIQLNGIGAFGIPGLASWDGGKLELDVPEIINEALTNIDYGANASTYVPEEVISSIDGLYDNEELQDTLKELREKQRQTRKKAYKIRREIRRTDDEDKRKELEERLDENNAALKQYSQQHSQALNSYKTERQARRVQKSNNAINAVFSTLCDYGQSLRALKKNEKFTLMIKGGVDTDGNKATQVYVIEQKSIKNCSDSKDLISSAIHYSL